MAKNRREKILNLWVARIIPVILIALFSYATWVVVDLVCVDYLFRSSLKNAYHTRRGAGIAILVLYFVLLLPVLVTFARLLQTIAVNPGYVPRGPQWYQQRQNKARDIATRKGKTQHTGRWMREKESPESDVEMGRGGIVPNDRAAAPSEPQSIAQPSQGLESFYTRDVFVCESDGRPIWCSTCFNWKPDRVGGIVSMMNFKFFIQFLVYAALYCIFVLVFMAVFVSEVQKQPVPLDTHFITVLALSSLFTLFTVGMAGSSIQLALINSTTVENLNRKTKVWQLAVHVPQSSPQHASNPQAPIPPMVPIPQGSSPPRNFAILRTLPGENPWDLGGPLRNLRTVMGDHVIDWFLPIKYSPICHREGAGGSAYPMGPVVARLRRENGISVPRSGQGPSESERVSERRHRKRRRRRDDPVDDAESHEATESRREEKRRRRRRRSHGGSAGSKEHTVR
ncbi:MAG: palmitoyltransferase pfa5 [Piccolia ochrophora]|nr:MAG: palmitoyltransferase pfa5 [Piccolia ochrophora]